MRGGHRDDAEWHGDGGRYRKRAWCHTREQWRNSSCRKQPIVQRTDLNHALTT